MKCGRQSAGFAPKDKYDTIRCTERRIPDEPRRLCREEIWLAERRQLPLERIPARPHPQVQVHPIVEARALHLTLVERKAERLDEMQCGAGSEARTASVPGVPVNLWMHEYDVGCRQESGALSGRRVDRTVRRHSAAPGPSRYPSECCRLRRARASYRSRK